VRVALVSKLLNTLHSGALPTFKPSDHPNLNAYDLKGKFIAFERNQQEGTPRAFRQKTLWPQ
jgi:hypothetical protein